MKRHNDLRRALRLLDISAFDVIKAVTAGVLALGSAIALGAVSAWLIARASQMPPVMMLSVATVGVRAFGVSRGLFRYLERLASHVVALKGMAALRTNLYDRLSRGNITAVARITRGDLVARVGSDVDAVGDVIVKAFIPALVAVVLSAASLLVVGLLYPPAALTLLFCMLLAGVLAPWLAQKAGRESEQQTAQARADISSLSHDLLTTPGPIVVSGAAPTMMTALEGHEQDLYRATDRNARLEGLSTAIFVFALVSSALLAALVAIPATAAGTLNPVTLTVVVLMPLAVFEIHQGLPAAALQLHTSSTAASRIMALLDAADENLNHDAVDPISQTGTRHLEAHNLTVGWPQKPVLSKVNVSVSPGETLAIVGPSGSGKSTLLMTLAGLIPPHFGTVTLDGGRIGPANQHDLAQHVAFIAEDAHVFDTTIFENLRAARGNLTHDEAYDALRQAGLSQWVEALPDGLETLLGPDGTTISGGERRRLLIARALCSSASILLLDEPAEHLDPHTADTLISDLMNSAANDKKRALVIATHRLTPIHSADTIIMLSQGRIDLTGTHDDLLLQSPTYQNALAAEGTIVQ
ncbi:thiol reductant ABC exporter subunit CydC [Jonesia quinghaiensis]|uniref:thiol reductant ABC exporter subunit CydC n=1 Tax=Jonesia quinghaiensis TaxID=262806 RepID=UPI00042A2817|nr:thiol reductant ABC exporter subunit CydC [Jonesia quinghaiensis]